MAIDDEEPFLECVVCHGDNGRERKCSGAMICKHNRCNKTYQQRRREARAAGHEPEQAPAPPPAKCRKIKDVLGVSLCLVSELSSDERRTGRESGDDDIQCEVRGGFGNDGDDPEDLIPDTRWVKLDDLVEAMEKEDLTKLFTFASQLKRKLTDAEKRLRRV